MFGRPKSAFPGFRSPTHAFVKIRRTSRFPRIDERVKITSSDVT